MMSSTTTVVPIRRADDELPELLNFSVYQSVLPASFSYNKRNNYRHEYGGMDESKDRVAASVDKEQATGKRKDPPQRSDSDSSSVAAAAAGSTVSQNRPIVRVMPLVQFLREHRERSVGWHRNHERGLQSMPILKDFTTPLEAWERQLVFVEILLLSGGTPYANFDDLAHAWGREKGFHLSLASEICKRRGGCMVEQNNSKQNAKQKRRRRTTSEPQPDPVADIQSSAVDDQQQQLLQQQLQQQQLLQQQQIEAKEDTIVPSPAEGQAITSENLESNPPIATENPEQPCWPGNHWRV